MRYYRPLMAGLAIVLLAFAAVIAVARYGAAERAGVIGIDREFFAVLGQRWLDTGTMYLPYQFAPYVMHERVPGNAPLETVAGLYPPIAGPVFVVLTALPAILWWAIPLGVIAWSLRRARPWTWPLLAAVACLPQTSSVVIVGGSTMWIAAGVAAGGPWALACVVKPSLAPFLLVGVRSRAFRLAGAILAGLSLLMLPEWIRYVAVLLNGAGPGLLYSLGDWPLLLALLPAAHSSWRRPHREHDPAVARARPLLEDRHGRAVQREREWGPWG